MKVTEDLVSSHVTYHRLNLLLLDSSHVTPFLICVTAQKESMIAVILKGYLWQEHLCCVTTMKYCTHC